MDSKQRSLPRLAATGAVIAGLAAGSYGIANAASGGGSSSGAATTSATTPSQTAPAPRTDETALTGDTLSKVTAAAEAKVPDGTIDRVEADADGNAAYEAHMTKADGTHVTVYVSAQFEVVSVETGGPGGPGGHRGPGGFGGPRGDETPLTGDTLSKATAAAQAKVPGATVVRAETDAEGNAAYEVHMTKADGTPVTVYVNAQFEVVSVETR
jgi:uncharacterized membrane protein YkoI